MFIITKINSSKVLAECATMNQAIKEAEMFKAKYNTPIKIKNDCERRSTLTSRH